jgi:hypothetical protein
LHDIELLFFLVPDLFITRGGSSALIGLSKVKGIWQHKLHYISTSSNLELNIDATSTMRILLLFYNLVN